MWGSFDLVSFLEAFIYSFILGAEQVYYWLFNDVTLGAWTFKPIYLIGSSLFLVFIVFWLKNKIIGDLG